MPPGTPQHNCRGIVTADVLELGLSRGAIAARKLEGVNAGQGTRGFILVRPLTVKVKAYVQFEVLLIRVTIARELNTYPGSRRDYCRPQTAAGSSLYIGRLTPSSP